MTVYVRLETDEAAETRENVIAALKKIAEVEAKGVEFERIRKEKKRSSIGIISRIREIEEEIRKIEVMLPKESLEMLKLTKQTKPLKQPKPIPATKPTKPLIKSSIPSTKEKIKKKSKKETMEEELLRIKKQLEELK